MNKSDFRSQLKNGVATSILGAVAFFGIQGEARASSICTSVTLTSPDTFNCEDSSVIPAATGSGTYTDGGAFSQGANGGFVISNSGSLSVVSNGAVNASTSSDQGLTSAVSLSATGALSFTNNGTISGSSSSGSLFTVFLRGDGAVAADTGQVSASGYRATGVFSQAFNGDNTTTGGTTTASGVWSRGIWTDAYNGNNITNTGVVSATGEWSRGVIANALQSANGCSTQGTQSTTVNVTGNVSADFVGIIAATCGTSTVNVQADRTVSTSGIDGQTIRNMATVSAVTNIYGTVAAASTADRALDSRSNSSSTLIGSTGTLSGTFSGDDGNDNIEIVAGGTWTSAATSEFWLGDDAVINNGTIQVDNAHFAGLESFTNQGLMAITGGSFDLTGATLFENNGTITVAPGETFITSDAVFVNNGVIDMQNDNVGDVLTITNGFQAGPASSILLDVANGQADQFVVNGGSAGKTAIYVSSPQGISSTGTQIGTVDGGKGTLALNQTQNAVSNFTMGNNASALINYELKQVGTAIYLLALPNSTAYRPLVLGELGEDLWHQSAGATLSQTRSMNPAQAKGFGFWGQLYASNDRSGERVNAASFGTDTVIDERTKSNRFGVQLGADVPISDNARAGMTLGYEKSDSDFRSSGGGLDLEAYNIGAYLSFGRESGFYRERAR